MSEFEKYIKDVRNFPKRGTVFRDITPLLMNSWAFSNAVAKMIVALDDIDFDVIAGLESRGFIFASPIAYAKTKPLALIRRTGKLPRKTIARTYNSRNGTVAIEMHKDAIRPGQEVVLIDDVIATGNTALAAANLIEDAGGYVSKIVCLAELKDSGGRKLLESYDYDVASLVEY